MSEWEGKSKGNKLGYQIFIYALRKGGLKVAYTLLYLVALHFFLFSGKSSKASYHFQRHKMGFSWWTSIKNVYRNYYAFGQSIIDKIVTMAGLPNKFSFEFNGEQHLLDMVAEGKGGILLSAHLGNWEIAGHLFTRLNTKIHVVMYDAEHAWVKQIMEDATGVKKMNAILIKPDLSHIYAIQAALDNKELVCMHADRFLPGNPTKEITFLNEPAPFPVGPFLLSSTFQVPVSFVFAFKTSNSHFKLSATPPKVYPKKNQGGIELAMQEFVSIMEEKVKQYPLQWYNYYYFWAKVTS